MVWSARSLVRCSALEVQSRQELKSKPAVDCWRVVALVILLLPCHASAADKLLGIHSARTMSQSMPWIAEEAGLFKKYDLDFQLVYISSASMVNAAMLSGSGDVAITGGESVVRTATQGVNEMVFIAAAKNSLTHSILSRPSKAPRAPPGT